MISADDGGRMLTYPLDTFDGLHPVFNEIAKHKTGIKGLTDRGKRSPIGMDIGQNQNSHA